MVEIKQEDPTAPLESKERPLPRPSEGPSSKAPHVGSCGKGRFKDRQDHSVAELRSTGVGQERATFDLARGLATERGGRAVSETHLGGRKLIHRSLVRQGRGIEQCVGPLEGGARISISDEVRANRESDDGGTAKLRRFLREQDLFMCQQDERKGGRMLFGTEQRGGTLSRGVRGASTFEGAAQTGELELTSPDEYLQMNFP
jgi:hypothetical protein